MTRRPLFEGLEQRQLLTFAAAVDYPVGASPQAVVTADFNNDGQLDLVTANTETVSFRPGDGSGGFVAAITSAAASATYLTQDRSLAVGDFNADGNLDLAMVNDFAITGYGDSGPDTSNGLSVMLGTGDGHFQAPANVPLSQGAKATSVAVGDFNADGTMDLAVGANFDYAYPGDVYLDVGRASVLLGNGDGSFQAPRYALVNPPVRSAVVADFNGDSHLDFLVGTTIYDWQIDSTVDVVKVLLGDGQGNLAVQDPNWSIDNGWSMATGDMDGDGAVDLVTANGSDVRVRLGNGTGGFEAPKGGQGYAAGTAPVAIGLGDFNRDGVPDIATANALSNDVSVLRGHGDGTFGSPEHFAAGSYTNSVAAGDFNSDGWLDVATANAGASTVSVLLNDGDWAPPPPALRISDRTVMEGNTGTASATFTVTLSAASTETITVAYATGNNTATAGSDYQSSNGTLIFAPGETSKTITVLVNGDRLVEPNETFVVNLSSPTNATIADGQGVGTIVDDEPKISISDVTTKEGNGKKTTLFVFTVTLSTAYDQPVTMSYRTVDGTATTGDSDYVAKTGTLTFNPGETMKTITIEVKGDNKKESNETFYLDLFGNSGNSLFTKSRGIGTILNDD